jgi:hypothetical protein
MNGRLTVPPLTSTAPTEAEVLTQASCPNTQLDRLCPSGKHRTRQLGVYGQFEGFSGAYITIIDP